MLVHKDGPIRPWLLLPVLAVLLGIAFAASVALAGTGAAAPAQGPAGAPSGARPQTTYMSTDVPKTLPVTGTVTSTLTIADLISVSSVDVVGVVISHTYPGDLKVTLTSPTGTRVDLFSNACGGIDWNSGNTGFSLSDGAQAVFGDTCPPGLGVYKPENPLAAFAGEPATGIWSLTISDNTDEDGGQLDAWGLAIPGAAPQPTPQPTAPPTLIPQPTATLCTNTFTDVSPADYFYNPVRFLVCKGAISGYADHTFRPYNYTTRGQMAKIVVLGLDVPNLPPPATGSFTDVPPGSPFFPYIEAGKLFGILSGYNDGTFRPNDPITRGQLTKMIVLATGVDQINPPTPAFSDVPIGSPFYTYVETSACYGWVSGYADGTFRWANNATRGQIAKIATLAETTHTPCASVPTPLPDGAKR